MTTLTDAIKRAYSRLDERFARDGLCIATGVPSLDDSGGLQEGEVLVVAGASGSGKTGLALSIALEASAHGTSVLYITFTEAAEELGERVLVNRANVDTSTLRRGRLERAELTRLTAAAAACSKLPFTIEAGLDVNLANVREAILAWRAEAPGLALVIVDPIQVLSADAARVLAKVAREATASMIWVSQVVQQRPDVPPRLADLDERGMVATFSTAVVFVHAPTVGECAREVIRAKHRRREVTVADRYVIEQGASRLRGFGSS